MIRKIEYLGFPNCVEVSNADAKAIISTDFGPRILFYSLDEGENILGWHPEAKVETDLGTWKPYGGHRLWMAPEDMPLSYAPDDEPVECEIEGEFAVRVTADEDAAGIEKELVVTIAEQGSALTIDHRLTNRGDAREMAAWGLTIMRPRGEAIIPNEPFKPYGHENLLPVRTMAVWSYTDLSDPRWSFGRDAIRLRVDENISDPQKFGVLNRQGWVGYEWGDLTFVKRFDFVEGASYPDMNSNCEVYTAGGFVEVETLSPLRKVEGGETVEHRETWELHRGKKAGETTR